MLFKSYFGRSSSTIVFDYSDIRPKGALLVTSGGKAPGAQPLKDCINKVTSILDSKANGDKLTPLEVHDLVCHLADAVLAGGIRRSALISLFSADDEDMLSCKSGAWWELNPQRGRANNSAVLLRHKVTKEFFMNLWAKAKASNAGEPAVFFTNDKEMGTNPCAEVSLKSTQLCNLCEVNVSDVESQEDLDNRVAAASFIGTIQASYTDFHYLRDEWKKTCDKEALLGISMTGIASGNVLNYNLKQAAQVAIDVNADTAKKIGINSSARITTVKPAGTSSIVVGSSSGIHAWHNDYYIRRVRVGKNEAIYTYLSIYHPELVEDDFFKPNDTAVISIPQKAPEGAVLRHESPLDMLERIKYVYENWVKVGHISGDNTHNISATVSLKDDEWEEVGEWMWENRNSYNGLSVLPFSDHTYVQAPFEDCDKETFERMYNSLKSLDITKVVELVDDTNLQGEAACAGGACEVV